MSSNVFVKRRVNGVAGSPGTGAEGELALNFPGVAGTTGLPELWAHDGAGWRRVNPPAGAISTQSVDLNTPGGADIGAAAAAWIAANAAFSGDIVIATYGTPAQAYVLTNPATPNAVASWTGLGGAVSFATGAEIHAGTDTAKAINSAILRGETLNVPGGAGGTSQAADANKLIRLNAQGEIDDGFLSFTPTQFRSTVDITAAYAGQAATWNPGDFAVVTTGGAPDASWNPVLQGGTAANPNIAAENMLFWDGTHFHVIEHNVNLAAYLPLAGGTMGTGAAINWTGAANAEAGTTILDGKGGTIDNVVIDAGTY